LSYFGIPPSRVEKLICAGGKIMIGNGDEANQSVSVHGGKIEISHWSLLHQF